MNQASGDIQLIESFWVHLGPIVNDMLELLITEMSSKTTHLIIFKSPMDEKVKISNIAITKTVISISLGSGV